MKRDGIIESILFVSHDVSSLSQICNKMIIMYAGHLQEYGNMQDMVKKPLHPYTNLLMNSLLVLMVLTFVLLFIAMIVLCKKFVMPRCCGCMKAFCTYIGNKLMFNSVIRGLLESYFPLCIATFYQLS